MIKVGIFIFEEVEELDFIAPFEVLSYANKVRPNSLEVSILAPSLEVVRAFNGLRIVPDSTLEESRELDVLIFPGGAGRKHYAKDEAIRSLIRERFPVLAYLASVCTGAFFLTDLLQGKRATTHHSALEELRACGVWAERDKVVQEGKIITAGGVSSGLELGFFLLHELFDVELASEVARRIEYEVDMTALVARAKGA